MICMPRERIAGWHDAWRRIGPAVITAVIFIMILTMSVIIAYFSMQGIEDYDSPDVPEAVQGIPSNAR